MFTTKHTDGSSAEIEYTLWSEVFACGNCGGSITYSTARDAGEDDDTKGTIRCPHCGVESTKRDLLKREDTALDTLLGRVVKGPKREVVAICYRKGKHTYTKTPDANDISVLRQIEKIAPPDGLPTDRMMHAPEDQDKWGDKWRAGSASFSHVHHLFLARTRHVLAWLWKRAESTPDRRLKNMLLFLVEQAIWTSSILNRFQPQGYKQVNKYLPGVYYMPSVNCEVSPWYALESRADRLRRTFDRFSQVSGGAIVATSSATKLAAPDNSIDYIFTDPPFGDNLAYAELNFIVEAFHRVFTNMEAEAIMSGAQKKGLTEYGSLMRRTFAEYYRVLKPGRWMTVVFSNTRASVWNAIQSAMQEAGFVVANVSALDKRLGSFNAVTTPTAVKQDLVISAYKPNGGLEERFAKRGETEEGVWDFVKTHLRNLPVAKARGGQLEYLAERDPRILYDRMVAFYVGHATPVPLSSAEFQAGLAERFPQRDEMFFLPEQVNEYDKRRQQMEGVGQLSIFVEDEKTAVAWLRNFLSGRPSVYSDILPEFMQQLSASWKKWEVRPELLALLEQNFLRYEGDGEVPSQIHSYLSTQFKEQRKLTKDDQQLRSKAKDRWFVPDPKKNIDVERVRTRKLLEEFWSYLPDGAGPEDSERQEAQGTALRSRSCWFQALLPAEGLPDDFGRRRNAAGERYSGG